MTQTISYTEPIAQLQDTISALPMCLPKKTARDPYDGLRFWSALTHGIGAAVGAAGGIVLIVLVALGGAGALTLTSLSIYMASMIMLYLASCLYHCVNTSVRGRLCLRKMDHAMIYVLIAGTYTPVCLSVLGGVLGWTMFGIVWALAALGVLVTMLWLNAPRWLTTAFYIGMGWMALFAIAPLLHVLTAAGIFWMVAGGLTYTVGGVLYALKWPCRKNPRFGCHEIFHLFILGGSLCFMAMLFVEFL